MTSIPEPAVKPALECKRPEFDLPPAVAIVASLSSSFVAADEQPLSSANSYPVLELALSQRLEPEVDTVPQAGVIAAPESLSAVASSVTVDEEPLSSSNSCATLVAPPQQLEPEAGAAPPPVPTVPVGDQFFTPSNSYAALALSPTSPVKPRRQYILPSHALSRHTGAIADDATVGLGFPDATPAFRKATAVNNAHFDDMDTDSDEEDDIGDGAAALFDTPSPSEAPSTSESDVEPAGDDATSQVRDTAAEPALDETAPTWALAHKRQALEFWGNIAVAIVFTVLAIVWTCFAAMPKLIEKVDDDGWTAFFQLEAGFVWSFVTLLWLQTYRRQHLWLVAFENMALASSFVVGIGGYAALALGTQYVFESMKAVKEGGGGLAATTGASCNSSVSL